MTHPELVKALSNAAPVHVKEYSMNGYDAVNMHCWHLTHAEGKVIIFDKSSGRIFVVYINERTEENGNQP